MQSPARHDLARASKNILDAVHSAHDQAKTKRSPASKTKSLLSLIDGRGE